MIRGQSLEEAIRAEAKRLGMPNPFLKLEWDFRLAPETGAKARKRIAASDAIA